MSASAPTTYKPKLSFAPPPPPPPSTPAFVQAGEIGGLLESQVYTMRVITFAKSYPQTPYVQYSIEAKTNEMITSHITKRAADGFEIAIYNDSLKPVEYTMMFMAYL